MTKKKRSIFSFFVLFVLISSFRFFDGPVFSPKFTTFNFDTVVEGTVVYGKFPFQNTGNKPLLVEYASASDIATVAWGPKEMVPPHKWDTIFFHFNTASKSGAQKKTIIVKHSGDEQTTTLQFKGFIKPKSAQ